MYAAIDLVIDKLEKQIVRQKEKLKQPRRNKKGEITMEGNGGVRTTTIHVDLQSSYHFILILYFHN